MKIAMVMLTFNRLEFTKIVIDNYFKTTKVPHKLLVWDNHSSDGSREWLDRVAKKKYPLRVHLCKRNIGVPDAIRGFFAHPSYQGMDLVGKIDNDILVQNGWLEGFVEAFEKVPRLGVVAGYNAHNPPQSFRKINGVMLNSAKYGMLGSVWLARHRIFEKYPFREQGYAGPWNYFRTLGTRHNVFIAYHRKGRFETDRRQWGGESPFPDIDYKKYYAQIAAYRGKRRALPT